MRALLVAAALAATTLVGPGLRTAAVDGGGLPVDDYATYQPQTTCSKKAKAGTVALGQWLVATYGGGGGAVNRPCSGCRHLRAQGRPRRRLDPRRERPGGPGPRQGVPRRGVRHRRRGQPARAGPPDGDHVRDLGRPLLRGVRRVREGAATSRPAAGAVEVLQDAAAPRPHAHLAVEGRRQGADQLLRRPACRPSHPDSCAHGRPGAHWSHLSVRESTRPPEGAQRTRRPLGPRATWSHAADAVDQV